MRMFQFQHVISIGEGTDEQEWRRLAVIGHLAVRKTEVENRHGKGEKDTCGRSRDRTNTHTHTHVEPYVFSYLNSQTGNEML